MTGLLSGVRVIEYGRNIAAPFAGKMLAHLGVLAEVDHPRIGPHRVTHPAFRLSETPADIGQGALIGEHTEHVLKNFLGLSEAEYAALEAAEALQ